MNPFEKACREWLKGCTCATPGKPWECIQCTEGLHGHLAKLVESQSNEVQRLAGLADLAEDVYVEGQGLSLAGDPERWFASYAKAMCRVVDGEPYTRDMVTEIFKTSN